MASYPGFGQPISQYGYNPDGSLNFGPMSGMTGAQGWFASGPDTAAQRPAAPAATSSTSMSFGPNAEGAAFYHDVLSGNKLPYDQATQDSIYSTSADMASQAEGANNQRSTEAAVRGGASANDPSRQGALLANQAMRQSQTQQAKRDITTKANTANFGAQMDAAAGSSQLSMEQQRLELERQRMAMGAMSGYGGGGGGGSSRKPATYGSNQGFIGFGPTPASRPNYWNTPATPDYNVPDDYDSVMSGPTKPQAYNPFPRP